MLLSAKVGTGAAISRRGRTVVAYASGEDSPRIRVAFRLPYRTNFGENLCLVGSACPLGAWDVSKGVSMTWTDGDVWRAELELELQEEEEQQYKYCIKGPDGKVVSWMQGENIGLKLPAANAAAMEVMDAWDRSTRDVVWDEASEEEAVVDRELNLSREEEVNVVASAARRAFIDLEGFLEDAVAMMASATDPTDPEALKADLKISGQARKAMALAGAMEVAQEPIFY